MPLEHHDAISSGCCGGGELGMMVTQKADSRQQTADSRQQTADSRQQAG